MSSLILSGDTSGQITFSAPSVAGTNTITLPANTGTVITTGSSGQVIPKAALPTGSVLQVVQATYSTETTIATTTYTDTGLSCSITPTSSTSKILVMVNQQARQVGGSNPTNAGFKLKLLRSSTSIVDFGSGSGNTVEITADNGGNVRVASYTAVMYLDSPATTSSTTYKTQASVNSGSGFSASFQGSSTGVSVMTLMEISA